MRIAVNAVQQQIGALLNLRLSVHAGAGVIEIDGSLQTLHIRLADIVDCVVVSVVVSELAHEVHEFGTADLVSNLVVFEKGREILKVHGIPEYGDSQKGEKENALHKEKVKGSGSRDNETPASFGEEHAQQRNMPIAVAVAVACGLECRGDAGLAGGMAQNRAC